MKLNSKLTGGLAWAGLVVVLAVPAADLVTGKGDTAANLTSDMDAIRTATIASPETVAPQPKPVIKRPAAVAVPATEVAATSPTANDPVVDAYIQSGKKLPSYISDAPTEVASGKPAVTPKLVVPGAQTVKPVEDTQIAALPAQSNAVAPIPYPASKRPTAFEQTTVATVAPAETPLIIDEDAVQRREDAVAAVLDEDRPTSPRIIESDQLEEWDSGSLADYLERRGLISGKSDEASAGEFDDDGFFLDDGPNNNSKGRRVVKRVRPNEFFFF
jgi:hypothetical protein